MKRAILFAALVVALSLSGAALAWANSTAQTVPFSQNWSTTTQVSSDNNWTNVPGINGYSGDFTFTAGSDPQNTTADGAALGLNVRANQGNPNTLTTGGVAEFDRSPTTNPTVALQPSDTHDMPHLVMTLDTRNKKNVNVSYLLRDIDGSADNAAQQIVLQYRVGTSGNYTNLPAGYVADATTGPSLATKETKVGVTLPSAAENQATVQVRVASANAAAGNDEWVGVDDISVSSVPVATLSSPPLSANEGETKTYNYTVSDTDSGDTFTVKSGFPDCGTGGSISGTPTKTSTGGSFQCRFPDGAASPTVRVQVADEDGGTSNTATRGVTVANAAPTITLDGPATSDEGQTKSYSYTVSDPGDDPNPTLTENCGNNGTKNDTPEAGGFGCRFPDGPSSSTVSVSANDGDAANNTASASRSVTVSNVAPSVNLEGPGSADEGQTKTYDFTVADPGQDGFTPKNGFPACGTGGSLVSGSAGTTAGGGSFRCRFPDGPADPAVRVQVSDSDGSDSGVSSRAVAVANVAPTANLTGPGSANEGETKAYDLGVSDPGDDTLRFTPGSPGCGDNGRLEGSPVVGDGAFRCSFPDGPATSTVGVRISDSDDAEGSAATDVTVANVAPAVELNGPASTEEGRTEAYSYFVRDPGADPDPAVTEDCGPNGRRTDTPAAGGFECRFPDGPAFSTVAVSATDEDGAATDAAVRVDIANVAPEAAADPADGLYAAEEDAPLTIGAGGGLLANDVDRGEDGPTARKASDPARGGVEVSGDGSFVYRPAADFNGEDSFTYQACDEDGACSDPATARVRVAAVNDAPVNAVPEPQQVREDGALIFSGAQGNAISVSDKDGNLLSTTVTATGGTLERRDINSAAAENPSSTVTAQGTPAGIEAALEGLRFVPEADRDSDAEIRISTDDGGNTGSGGPLTDEDTVAVGIEPVNDAPEISDVPDAATDEDTATEALPFTVEDVDTPANDLSLSGAAVDAQLVPGTGFEFGGSGGERTVRITPAADRFGETRVSVTVSDGGAEASDDLALTVRDKTPPAAPSVDLDAGSDSGRSDSDNVTNDATPVLSGTAEAGSEVALFDGGDRFATVTAGGDGWRHEVPESGAFDGGDHALTATATDGAGNTSETSAPLDVTVDRNDPDTFVDASPPNRSNAVVSTFEFSSDETDASFECFVDDPDFQACGSPQEYRDLADGEHVFEARAIDRAGNVDGSPAMRSWTVDTRAPEVALSNPADGALVRGEVFVTADASDDRELEKVEFLIDGEVADVDRGVAAERDEPYEFGWDTTIVGDGEHTFAVRATDAAGNEASSGTRTARVDNTAPDTVVTASPNNPTNAAVIPFGFRSGDGGATFECSFDDNAFEPCASPKEYEFAGSRADGDYVFRVRAVDEAGNRDGSPAERVVTLDTRAPEAPVVELPADGVQDNDGALVFSGTAEPGSRVTILELSGDDAETRAVSRRAGDDGAWSVGFAGVLDGEHRYVAVATDPAGNGSERSGVRTVTVDTVAPEVVGVSPGRNALDVPINTGIEVEFSKRIEAATLEGNLSLTRERDGSVTPVAAGVEYDAATNSAFLRPTADLGYSESYTVTVRGGESGVKDLAGSGLAADDSWTFTTAREPDTTAPDAPTIEQPEEDIRDDDGLFTVSGAAEPGSRVRLFEADTLVGAAIAGQAGAWSLDLADVPEGSHTYQATATDDARNESGRSAGRTVVVDQTSPDTLIESSPDSFTNSLTHAFGFSSTESDATFECSLDGDAFERCVFPQKYDNPTDGDHVFEVRSVDRAGNVDPSPARRSFVVDREAPQAGVTSPAEGALVRGEVRFTADVSDNRGVKRVEFLVDGKVVDSDLEGPYEFGWDSELEPDGARAVEVRVTDLAGNTATSAPRGIRTDNTVPDTRVTSSPDTLTNAREALFGFSSAENGAAFECSLDGVEFEPCASPKEYTALPDGDYLFTVRAKDAAGNRDETPAQRRLTVDTEAPAVSIDSGPAGTVSETTARLSFSAEPGATFGCRIDGGDFRPCGPTAEFENLGEGGHAFEVRATDRAGNTGPVARRAWTVQTTTPDATGPTIQGFGPKGNRATTRSVVSVVFSEKLDPATASKATFRLVKKGTPRPVTATVVYDPAGNRVVLRPARPLVRGSVYTATVTTGVEDLAGNPLAANKTWRFRVR